MPRVYLQLAFQFLETIWKKPLHLFILKILIGINKIIIWFQHLLFPWCSFQNYLTNYPFKDLAQTQTQLLCWNNFSPFKKILWQEGLSFYFICISYLFPVGNTFGVKSSPVYLSDWIQGPHHSRQDWLHGTRDLCSHTWPHAQNCPALGLMLCCHYLKIPNFWAGALHFSFFIGTWKLYTWPQVTP